MALLESRRGPPASGRRGDLLTEQILGEFALITLGICLLNGKRLTALPWEDERMLIQRPFDNGSVLYNDIWTLGKVLE